MPGWFKVLLSVALQNQLTPALFLCHIPHAQSFLPSTMEVALGDVFTLGGHRIMVCAAKPTVCTEVGMFELVEGSILKHYVYYDGERVYL